MRRLVTRWWFWIVISPVLVIAVYAALVLVFVLGKPTISRNFSKELNEHALAIPEGERADKVYRKAAAAFPDMPEDLLAQDSRWPELEPDDPKWDAAREYAKESARGLTLLRQAAAMPNLGLVVSNVPVVDYNLGPSRRVLEQELPPPEENPSLIDLALPHLGAFRAMERVLAFDARLALHDRDSSRASADYAAMLGIARHAAETPVLLTWLVSEANATMACRSILQGLQYSNASFTDVQLAPLDRALASLPEYTDLSRPFAGERDYFEDFLQRIYTDDGHGDGHLCYTGAKRMHELVSWTSVTGSTGNNLLVTAEMIGSGPLVMFFDDSRRELSDRHRHAIDDLIAYGKKPPWTRDRVPMLPVSSSSPSSLHFGQALMDAVFPAFGRSIPAGIRTQMYIAGTKAAIAVERHRLAHGSYPASLAELVPAYLASVPVDQFDGKALRYKVVDGKPLLYSVGCDGVDNGGTPYTPSDGASTNGHTDQWVPMNDRSRCPNGDWIIWPIHKPTPVGGK